MILGQIWVIKSRNVCKIAKLFFIFFCTLTSKLTNEINYWKKKYQHKSSRTIHSQKDTSPTTKALKPSKINHPITNCHHLVHHMMISAIKWQAISKCCSEKKTTKLFFSVCLFCYNYFTPNFFLFLLLCHIVAPTRNTYQTFHIISQFAVFFGARNWK